jgi:hypothetical protein
VSRRRSLEPSGPALIRSALRRAFEERLRRAAPRLLMTEVLIEQLPQPVPHALVPAHCRLGNHPYRLWLDELRQALGAGSPRRRTNGARDLPILIGGGVAATGRERDLPDAGRSRLPDQANCWELGLQVKTTWRDARVAESDGFWSVRSRSLRGTPSPA